jgi:rhamnosyltransferase
MTRTASVVIRCRNEEAHIGRLLTGLLRQRQKPDEIIVVDSGSTDATLAIASAFPVRVVHIAAQDFSFGAACNVGCEAAEGDIVVFVSAHCYPIYDTWVENLLSPLREERIALSYGRQVPPEDSRYSERRIFGTWFPADSTSRQRHPFCNNANAAIRRSIWLDGLHYDEHLTGLEDLDWAGRAISAGFLLAYVAEAPVVHVHDETFGEVVNRYRREAVAHRQIDDEQVVTLPGAARLAVTNIASDLAAAYRDGCLRDHVDDIPRFRFAQFWGTYRGSRQRGPVTSLLRQRFFYPDGSHRGDSGIGAEALGQPIDYEEPIDHAELHS